VSTFVSSVGFGGLTILITGIVIRATTALWGAWFQIGVTLCMIQEIRVSIVHLLLCMFLTVRTPGSLFAAGLAFCGHDNNWIFFY
jgi:hypothetical protein